MLTVSVYNLRMLSEEEHKLLLLRQLHIRRDLPHPRPGDSGGRAVHPQQRHPQNNGLTQKH